MQSCSDCKKYLTLECAADHCYRINWRPLKNKSKNFGCVSCIYIDVFQNKEPCKSCGHTHFEPKEKIEYMESIARREIQALIDKPGDDTDFRTDLLNWVEKNYVPDSVFKDQLVKQAVKVLESEAIVNLKHAYEQAEARKKELQRLVERYRKERRTVKLYNKIIDDLEAKKAEAKTLLINKLDEIWDIHHDNQA